MDKSPQPVSSRQRSTCLGMMLGGFLALVLVCAAVVYWFRLGRLPDVDNTVHAREFLAWEKVAPPSYDIQTSVTGQQPANYIVQVRDHKVVFASRNGTPLLQQRTMGTWSVPGMFDTMERDLTNEATDRDERLTPDSPRVNVRARFHPKWHYPEAYQRIEWGSQYEVEWTVSRFNVIESNRSTSVSE